MRSRFPETDARLFYSHEGNPVFQFTLCFWIPVLSTQDFLLHSYSGCSPGWWTPWFILSRLFNIYNPSLTCLSTLQHSTTSHVSSWKKE
ncbi:hypothetical protein ILYODFUR_026868 [Ilyodon furcidens]|uniref:Uncharacterized protein n=1 Tax=Ilyodon furcidens TaxID=33524 RepID=A0ABV0UA38_9TELE